eukprot:3726515-Heterocapsa_arctica.AAC.1
MPHQRASGDVHRVIRTMDGDPRRCTPAVFRRHAMPLWPVVFRVGSHVHVRYAYCQVPQGRLEVPPVWLLELRDEQE